MNTMADLRERCATRMRKALHGREIDTLENSVQIPHMLDITPIGAIHTRKVEEGTIMDPDHRFWQEFEEGVKTEGSVRRKIESAIRSLRKDDIFRMTYPYGEEADIVYCEVDEMGDRGTPLLPTTCHDCGESIEVPLELNYREGHDNRGTYTLDANLDCPHCGFSRLMGSNLTRK